MQRRFRDEAERFQADPGTAFGEVGWHGRQPGRVNLKERKLRVQRPRLRKKLRNVLARLPREQQGQTGSLMRAAWKLGAKEGMAKFRQIAAWWEHDYPDAAKSLLEGLEECSTINRLDVPRSLHRCLATSNVVDNPHSGVRSRTRRVCRWRPGMAAHWSAAAFVENEKSFRKIMGYRDLWALKAIPRWVAASLRAGRWLKITMTRRSQLLTRSGTPSQSEYTPTVVGLQG